MRPDFWLERWRKNEIGFHQHEINVALKEYWPRLELPATATVFVPLCGKSRDLLWLRSQGHRILGVELVRIAVRDFFAENALTPRITAQPPFECWEADGVRIWCGDFFDLSAADLQDIAGVYDRASLIALPTDMRGRYVDKLNEILPPAARMLLVTMSYPAGEMQGPPFAVTEQEVSALYAGKFHLERLATKDILSENARFRERGLTQMTEQVYRIRKTHSQ